MDPEAVLLSTPLVTGLVEVYKRAGLPKQYAGVASVVSGLAIAALVVSDPTSAECAITGIATGLAASGLYSQYDQLVKPAHDEAVRDA